MKITNMQINQLSIDKGFKPSVFHDQHICATVESMHEFARALIAMAQEVPDLEFIKNTAKTKGGKYEIYVDSVGMYRAELETKLIGTRPFDIHEEAKAYCNEHNRKRVLSQLKYGGE